MRGCAVVLSLTLALTACKATHDSIDLEMPDASSDLAAPGCPGTRACGTATCGPGEACLTCSPGALPEFDMGDPNSYVCVPSSFQCDDESSCWAACQGSARCGPARSDCSIDCGGI